MQLILEIFFITNFLIGIGYASYLLTMRYSTSNNQEHYVGIILIAVPFWTIHLISKLIDKKYRTI